MFQESTAAAMALSAFVRMPLFQHGSGKAIEHCEARVALT
jgi:hypothetical protein